MNLCRKTILLKLKNDLSILAFAMKYSAVLTPANLRVHLLPKERLKYKGAQQTPNAKANEVNKTIIKLKGITHENHSGRKKH